MKKPAKRKPIKLPQVFIIVGSKIEYKGKKAIVTKIHIMACKSKKKAYVYAKFCRSVKDRVWPKIQVCEVSFVNE